MTTHVEMGKDAKKAHGPNRRTNETIAVICDRAIEFAEIIGREYAESLLRMYGLKTGTIMRVLFDAHNRRAMA